VILFSKKVSLLLSWRYFISFTKTLKLTRIKPLQDLQAEWREQMMRDRASTLALKILSDHYNFNNRFKQE